MKNTNWGDVMQLNEAICKRVSELLLEKKMNGYQLSTRTGLPKSTVSNILNCTYNTMSLRVIHEICQGLDVSLTTFFDSPLFNEDNLEP